MDHRAALVCGDGENKLLLPSHCQWASLSAHAMPAAQTSTTTTRSIMLIPTPATRSRSKELSANDTKQRPAKEQDHEKGANPSCHINHLLENVHDAELRLVSIDYDIIF